jgi:hypothetical protein
MSHGSVVKVLRTPLDQTVRCLTPARGDSRWSRLSEHGGRTNSAQDSSGGKKICLPRSVIRALVSTNLPGETRIPAQAHQRRVHCTYDHLQTNVHSESPFEVAWQPMFEPQLLPALGSNTHTFLWQSCTPIYGLQPCHSDPSLNSNRLVTTWLQGWSNVTDHPVFRLF